MAFDEYWIGKGVDYRAVWEDYELGLGYMQKYGSMEVHLLQLSFDRYRPNLPLFNFEAILKTSKGLFHDLKASYFSPSEYDRLGPLFIYDVSRGSERWRFLGELKPLLLFGVALWNQIRKGPAHHKFEQVELIDRLRQRFPNADFQNIVDYVNSFPGKEEQLALQKLNEQNIKSIEISQRPFLGDIAEAEKQMISFNEVEAKKKKDR
jgi:hypothetical protein